MDDNQDAGSSQSPREYDFSSDLNISEVKDDSKKEEPAPAPNDPIFKSISEAVDKSLSEAIKKPASAPEPKQDPFREPINKLDMEWPFATPETLAKHQARPANPAASEPAPVPTPAPAPAPKTAPVPQPAQKTASIPPNLPGAQPIPRLPVQQTPQFRPSIPVAPQPRPQPQPQPAPSQTPPAPAASVPSTNSEVHIPDSGNHPGGLRALRTYESDVAEVLASRPVSRTSMALAESKKRGEGETIKDSAPEPKKAAIQVHSGIDLEEKSHLGLKFALVIIALVLIAGGAFGGYYLYKQSPLGTPTVPVQQQQPAMTSIIPYDSRIAVNTDNANEDDVLSRIRMQMKASQPPETIREFIFTETKNGLTYRVTAPEMMLLAAVPVPDIIARTIQPEWMFGTYADGTGTTTPFVIIRTNLFQNAFAGMLSWEQAMPVDLKTFFGIPASTPTPTGSFKDRIVRNKDVRAFVMSDGQTLFEYSFVDESTLVVAANDAALSLIISRLESKAFVR